MIEKKGARGRLFHIWLIHLTDGSINLPDYDGMAGQIGLR